MMFLITIPLAFLKWFATVGVALFAVTFLVALVVRKFVIPLLMEKDSSKLVKNLVILAVSLIPVALTMGGLEIFKDFLPIYSEADLSVRFYAKLEKAIFFYTSLGVSSFASLYLVIYSKRKLQFATANQ